MIKKSFVIALAVVAMGALMTAGTAQAATNVALGSYGVTWDYGFTGDAAGTPAAAFDGTWIENKEWDGSAPGTGGSSGTSPAPGGMASYTESGVTYLRMQDTGDTSSYAVPFSGQVNFAKPGNRRYRIRHDITVANGDPAAVDLLGPAGGTITFRTRIATTGTLDDEYREAGAGTFAWGTAGHGSVPNDDARSMFGVSSATNGSVGFALALDADTTVAGVGGGLIFNNNPSAPAGVGGQNAGSAAATNIVSQTDAELTAFNEYFITLQPDALGNIRVRVFKNGSLTPQAFTAKRTFSGDHGGTNTIYGGMNSGSATFAIDIDYFAYKAGVQQIPEPATFALGLMGLVGLGFVGYRRRR